VEDAGHQGPEYDPYPNPAGLEVAIRLRIVVALTAVTGASAALTASAAAVTPNLLGNGRFEHPVVSGKLKQPTGSHLGPCTSLPSGPGHCWLVTSDRTALIHDDFMTGGFFLAPEEGHQLLWLSAPSPTGQFGGGAVQQDAAVPPSSSFTLTLWFAADPSRPAGTGAYFQVAIDFCNDLGSACQNARTAGFGPLSTGDPAAPGWSRVRLPNLFTNADQSLARLRFKTVADPSRPAAGLIDAVSLK
jgi:hypothetical protein